MFEETKLVKKILISSEVSKGSSGYFKSFIAATDCALIMHPVAVCSVTNKWQN